MRREFDPLEWFASLGADARVAAVREVVEAFSRVDPGFANATAMWRRGKTARVEILVPSASPLPFGAHLGVEGGEPRLLRNLVDRVERGDLEFGNALVEAEDGSREGAMAASLGVGSVVVTARMGELMLRAVQRQRLVVPVAEDAPRGRAGIPFLVGSKFPGSIPDREGFLLMLVAGQLVAVGNYDKITPRDARLLRTGPARVGLAVPSESLLLLCLEIRGFTDGWVEMPFALAIEPPEQRRLEPPDAQGRMALAVVLIDRSDGTVRTIRLVSLSKKFTSALLDAIDAQQDAAAGYDRARYLADYAEAQRRWPTLGHVEKSMVVRELVRDGST